MEVFRDVRVHLLHEASVPLDTGQRTRLDANVRLQLAHKMAGALLHHTIDLQLPGSEIDIADLENVLS